MMWEFKCHTGSGRRKGEMEAAFPWAPVIHRMSGRLSLIAPQVVMRIMLRGPDPTSKATLWVKAQHEGALPLPCIVHKDKRVPHTPLRLGMPIS